jgi:hemoglobin-like flavoprotein
MTPQQIEIVQQSFGRIAPIAPLAADLFYARLFELDPQLRLLFKSDIKRQGMTLMTMLSSAVRGLKNPDALFPVLKSLGRRHAVYRVQDSHYAVVAQALLDTLRHALGDEFDDETREAWAAAYALMASVMQIGAREMAQPASANDGEEITSVHQLVA